MASGKTHDFINLLALPPLVYYFRPEDFIPFVLGYLAGTFLLSPDNDLYHSKSVKRWKFLRFIWYPLTKFSKHRGLSHIPIVGSLIRLGYLSLMIFLFYITFLYITKFFNLSFLPSLEDINFKQLVLNIHFISFFLGLVCAEIIHIIVDIFYSLFKKLRLIK